MNTPRRVLLVEDDLEFAGLYKMRLEAEGLETKHVQNGEDALQAARDFQPDLILLDVMMPKLSGFEVLDILKNTAETRNTKIVVLSALGQASDRQRAKDLGADDYFVKSQVLITDVMSLVRNLLKLPPFTGASDSSPAK
ncbi:MAG TPA: response regulator [Candidatus Saccharimonadia bacterium]|jgi:DNA-binding response OmpR family regulator